MVLRPQTAQRTRTPLSRWPLVDEILILLPVVVVIGTEPTKAIWIVAFAIGASVVVIPYLFFMGDGASTTIPLVLAMTYGEGRRGTRTPSDRNTARTLVRPSST